MRDLEENAEGIGSDLSRRSMLGGVAGTMGVPFWLDFDRDSVADPRVAPAVSKSNVDEEMMQRIPPYPDDAFLITQYGDQYFTNPPVNGWKPVSHREQLRTIQRFHPDALDWDSVMSFDEGDIRTYKSQNAQIAYSLQTNLPGTSGRNITINIPDEDAAEKYQAVFDAYDWQFPDGSPVVHPRGLLAEQFDGTPQRIEYDFETNGIPSVFAPGAVDVLMYVAKKRLSAGYSAFWIDGIGVFRFQGLDFSTWAQDAFRSHLESLSSSRRQELGIDDTAAFDIRDYLRDAGLAPDDSGDPFGDAVFREYLLHHHQGVKQFFAACEERLHEMFPERRDAGDIKLYGNHFMGNFGHPQAANVYAGDHFDTIHVEHFPSVDPPVDYHYKLERAIGRFNKPATAKGTLAGQVESNLNGLDSEKRYPNLKRFQIAESYAMGARMKIPLTTGGAYSVDQALSNWIQADGTVPNRLQSFVDFLWTHERFLADIEPDNRVAVVWSLPTLLWNHEPQWNVGAPGDSPNLGSFVGTTTLLREAQIPYDILVFGHPRLWEDTDQLDRLREYDAVVLPSVDNVTDSQLAALESYLGDGGNVVTSGPPPSRDEMHKRREDTAAVFEHESATVLVDDPGKVKNQHDETTGDLQDALEAAAVQTTSAAADPTLSISRHAQTDPDRVVVHALNYDYTVETDTFDSKTSVSLSISKPDFEVGAARYYTPKGSTDLSVTEDGQRLSVTLPELGEWGFVVLARSATALVNADAEEQSREVTESVGNNLAAASKDGRDWSDAFVSAEVYHDAAKTALNANAYRNALDAAQTANEKLREATRQPVIGIDIGHGQVESLEEGDSYGDIRNAFPRYDFRMLETVDETTVGELDVLIVPPALAYRGGTYNFPEAYIEAVESFVENGGSLLVLARGGVHQDVDKLTEPFGFRFHGRPVVFPERKNGRIEPLYSEHLLTRGISEISFNLGTPIGTRPSESTVLAKIPEDSEGWFHQEQPLDSRSDREESAAGSEMYVTANYGSGRVTLFGMHHYHLMSERFVNVEQVVRNQLAVLGPKAVRAKSSSQEPTETTTEPPSTATEQSPTTEESTSPTPGTDKSESATSSPGFSFTSGALAGVAALLSGWLWKRSGDDG